MRIYPFQAASVRRWPQPWRDADGREYVCTALMIERSPDPGQAEPFCFCAIYRRQLWSALLRGKVRRAIRYGYYGALRLFELDEKREASHGL